VTEPSSLFGKRAGTIVHEAEPFNAEPPCTVLAESSLTPVDAFYARSHGSTPVAVEDWTLDVGGLVEYPLRLTMEELREGRFAHRDVVATLQCAGNRRRGLIEVRDIPGEAPWGPGATGTAAWRGVALVDVLAAAGIRDGAGHVAFVGADRSEEAKPPQLFGASIPIDKARGEEVLLAWSMNGADLPALHGAPLRVIVPGYIGARSVKWLTSIDVRDTPFDGYFQDTVYRLLAPDEKPGPGRGMALGEVALNSEVLVPDDGADVPAGRTEVRGYAFAGGGRHVARVDVSLDGGTSWRQAELLEDLGRWAWRLWRLQLELAAGTHEIVVRAWDSAAASQPEHAASLWNPKGYVNNAWGRARVTTR
jgi:sulfite oxidase